MYYITISTFLLNSLDLLTLGFLPFSPRQRIQAMQTWCWMMLVQLVHDAMVHQLQARSYQQEAGNGSTQAWIWLMALLWSSLQLSALSSCHLHSCVSSESYLKEISAKVFLFLFLLSPFYL